MKILITTLAAAFLLLTLVPQEGTAESSAPTAALDELTTTVEAGAPIALETMDLTDFRSKAQSGLDFMKPGASVGDIRVVSLTGWSTSLAASLTSYLHSSCLDAGKQFDIDQVRTGLRDRTSDAVTIAVLSWEISIEQSNHTFRSVAVFDAKSTVLFDTVLVDFVGAHAPANVESSEASEKRSGLASTNPTHPSHSAAVACTWPHNVGTGIVTEDFFVYGILPPFAATLVQVSVTGRVEISPYITGATNDAVVSFVTENVSLVRTFENLFAPVIWPATLIGEGIGPTPICSSGYKTPISLVDNDRFGAGTYTVQGEAGLSFNVDPSIEVGWGPVGLSIPITGACEPFGLDAPPGDNELWLLDRGHGILIAPVGFFQLSAQYPNQYLSLAGVPVVSESGPGELGKCRVNVRINNFYFYYVNGILFFDSPESADEVLFEAQYIRGDHILEPTVTMSSSCTSAEVGQDVDVVVTVTNNSEVVSLEAGQVTLDVGSLGGLLSPISLLTVDLGTIDPSSAKDYTFSLQAYASGPVPVTPQAFVTADWCDPVPPDVTINSVASLFPSLTVNPAGTTVDALTTVYNSTGGDQWLEKAGWLSGPVETWHGVTVENCEVTRLELPQNNLTGPIPAALSALTGLKVVDLLQNNLTGEIPSELGHLSKLQSLELSGNQLSGSLPATLGNATSLLFLSCYDNQLSGAIPSQLGNLLNLDLLQLGANDFSGTLPSELGSLSALRFLFIADNASLTGELPSSLTSLTSLEGFQFSGTDLCEPEAPTFQAWLQGIVDVQSTGIACGLSAVEDVDTEGLVTLALRQNYPNPIHSQTNIDFVLPHEGQVSLRVFDVRGQEVAEIVTGSLGAGRHSFQWDTRGKASGIYFYRLTTSGTTLSKKLIVVN
jgi:Secretion system C-terminal sorting domain/Leucine rich repeat